jgi:ABC-type sugar transport systems, permease components
MLMGANGTETFVIQTVSKAFQFGKFGLASAMAVVLLVLVLAVTGIQRLIVKDERAELV